MSKHNLAYTQNARLFFTEQPEITFWGQNFTLPGVSMPGVETPFKNYSGSVPSNRIQYNPLSYMFTLDEEHENHSFILSWMESNTKADKLDSQLKTAQIHILNNNKQPSGFYYVFEGIYPVDLSEVTFEFTGGGVEPVILSATFNYQRYYRVNTAG